MSQNIAPQKSLGQHFLINQGMVAKIVDRIVSDCKSKGGWVLEVGPGPGALTQELLKRGLNVLAIEVDPRMVEHLSEKFKAEIQEGRLKLLLKNILASSPGDWQEEIKVACGNLPYNIGTDIVFKFLTDIPSVHCFTFMLQKEMVDRLSAPHGNRTYGAASVRFQWLVDIIEVFTVKPGSFSPPPKVDSAVICFHRKENVSPKFYNLKAHRLLDQIFQKRRKMLRSILPPLKDHVWAEKRPEQLSPTDFEKLIWDHLQDRLHDYET